MFPGKFVHLILPKFLVITQDFNTYPVESQKET